MKNLYFYKAKIVAVYDGDTVTAEVDFGCNLMMTMRLRLYGINAPEMRGPEKEKGKVSRDWLRKEILKKDVIIETYKDKKGKYGRWLAVIWKDDVNINYKLVGMGLAEEKHY